MPKICHTILKVDGLIMKVKVFAVGILVCCIYAASTVRGFTEDVDSVAVSHGKQGKIELNAYKWDIGDLSAGSAVKKTFFIKNAGEGNLFVEGVRVNCDCIKTVLSAKSVLPGKSVELEITYDSTGRRLGEDKKRVYVCTNDPDFPHTAIELSAKVVTAKGQHMEADEKVQVFKKNEPVGLANQKKTINIYVFVDTECAECVKTVEEYINPVIEKYNVNAVFFDINELNYFELLLSAEKIFNKKTPVGPAILFDSALLGEKEARSGAFEKKIKALEGKPVPFFDLEKIKRTKGRNLSISKDQKIEAVLFSTKAYCAKCRRLEKYLGELTQKYSNLLVKTLYIEDTESVLFYEYLGAKLSIPEDKILKTPAVVIGTQYFQERDQYYPGIERAIQEYETSKEPPGQVLFDEFKKTDSKTLKNRVSQRFKSFKAVPVAIAGLIDGINPCAFSVIIFFVTSLFVVRKKKITVLIVGLLFILVTFLTYFLIGVGVLKITGFLFMKKIGRFIYFGAGIALFVLAYLSLMDCINYCLNRQNKIILQLSQNQKKRIAGIISKNVRLKHIAGAIVFTAFIVSITELTCTGQIYLPTIMYISRIGQLNSAAIGLLCLYNVAFILPLVIVFFVFFFISSNSYQFVRFAKANVAIAKFLLFLCFLGLGIIFLVSGH